MEIKDKTVLVTGGGSGIGRALCQAFAQAGAKVVLCGRRREPLEQTREQIESAGGRALAVAADVTDVEQAAAMAAQAEQAFGPIEVLFNNAGRFHCLGPVWEVDVEDWWSDVTANLRGALVCVRAVLPGMIERNEGMIINMNGGRPTGGTGYASGKAGLMELTRVLTEELKAAGSKVMVFAASPGLVHTQMTQWQVDNPAGRQWVPSTQKRIEGGRTRSPSEVAQATVRLFEVARPELNGKRYGPDTDFEAFAQAG